MRVLGGLKYGASLLAIAGAMVAATTQAQAGGFAVREQSAYFQGMSFAGSAAGDALSSMFWNSAAAAAAPGINSETHVALVVPRSEITATGGALVDPLGFDTESGDIGDPTLVPASYANYQLNERLFLGMAINGQYGFTTKPDNPDFAGTPIASTSKIFSINFNPTVAYKFTPELTIGVGAQIIYADLRLSSNNDVPVDVTGDNVPDIVTTGRTTEADDWGFGATAGVIWQPSAGTTFGLGYRSRIELEGEGSCRGRGLSNLAAAQQGGNLNGCLTGANVTADLTLPDLVTASFKQRVTERLAVLGTVEWQNWSAMGAQAEFRNDAGQVVDVFPLDYDDGWFVSLGAEYAYSPDTTLRAGIGYEWSPINDDNRNVSLPDNDRVWLSVGLSTKLTERASIDLAYTHLFVKDSPINVPGGPTGTLLTAEAEGDIDIVAASFKYKWGASEPELEPLK
jgi:long-chain fatty acid transport protein